MENEKVKVYYCKCGKSIQRAAHPKLFDGNSPDRRAIRKEYKQAEEWGLKVAEITMDEYRKTPFYCYDKNSATGTVEGCVDLTKRISAELLHDEINNMDDDPKKFKPGGFASLARKEKNA